jgi:hypothetical protein
MRTDAVLVAAAPPLMEARVLRLDAREKSAERRNDSPLLTPEVKERCSFSAAYFLVVRFLAAGFFAGFLTARFFAAGFLAVFFVVVFLVFFTITTTPLSSYCRICSS